MKKPTLILVKGSVSYFHLKILFLLLILLPGYGAFCQTSEDLVFDLANPRSGKNVSASTFLSDFALETFKISGFDCYHAMGFYRFRISKTTVIDSVQFEGNLREDLRLAGERKSQPYWQCKSCEKSRPAWVVIPVMVAITTKTPCPADAFFYRSLRVWYSLFPSNGPQQKQVGKNEWLLAPMTGFVMR
jgi:hypothetical protein